MKFYMFDIDGLYAWGVHADSRYNAVLKYLKRYQLPKHYLYVGCKHYVVGDLVRILENIQAD